MKKKKTKIVLEDDKNVKNIVIQVHLKNNYTTVFSGFSSWENLAFIMEGLGATVQECVRSGISKKKVYDQVKKYIVEVLNNY